MQVLITEAARRDLSAIFDYLQREVPARAASLLGEILDRCQALSEMPQRYPLVPRYEHFGIRRCVQQNFLIFYRVGSLQVEIVHILHGAQDYEPILFPNV
jgi:toxin ParE1/3/4